MLRSSKSWLAILALALLSGGASAGFVAATLADNGARLVITADDGSQFAAPLLSEQVGFEQARISPDGKHVGWLALYPNISYPVPMRLVVLDRSNRLHIIDGRDPLIFKWCFSRQSTAVAFMQSTLHFSTSEHFELRAIANTELLATYDDSAPEPESENAAARKRAPSWVRCAEQ